MTRRALSCQTAAVLIFNMDCPLVKIFDERRSASELARNEGGSLQQH
jgi:hypothetical protein